MIGTIGVVSAFLSASLHYGISGAPAVLVLAMLLLVVLAFVRGFPRIS